jgi:hypothetical protein
MLIFETNEQHIPMILLRAFLFLPALSWTAVISNEMVSAVGRRWAAFAQRAH